VSHFLALVLVDPADKNPFDTAQESMKKFWSSDSEDENGNYIPDRYKCDGFVIGGRFDGVIQTKEQHYNLTPDEYQKRYGLDVVEPKDNIVPVGQLPAHTPTYAVVTPEGEWHERGRLPEPDWQKTLQSLLSHYQSHLAVAIDCHC
jgi:hypothetical protein